MQPNVTEVHEAGILQNEAPALAAALQEIVQADRGLSLSDVVGTIAALEALVLDQSMPTLKGAYALNEYPLSDSINEDALHEVLRSYLLLFRHGGPVNSTDIAGHRRIKARAQKAKDWAELVKFEREAVAGYGQEAFSFDLVGKIVKDMAVKYGQWQNSECLSMKSTLMHLDKEGTGRVLLDDFHAEPSHHSYQFTESGDFLRRAGALDDRVQDGEPQVLIANYLLGPSNCIAPSQYYTVCCINECEGLMSELELKVQSPQWPSQRLLNLVAETPSSSVEVPRSLADNLAEDLNAIAQRNEGAVPLHSADFQRWLHSAYPHECPLPTAAESLAEETERAETREWLNAQEAQKVCTRLPEWHSDVQGPEGDVLNV